MFLYKVLDSTAYLFNYHKFVTTEADVKTYFGFSEIADITPLPIVGWEDTCDINDCAIQVTTSLTSRRPVLFKKPSSTVTTTTIDKIVARYLQYLFKTENM